MFCNFSLSVAHTLGTQLSKSKFSENSLSSERWSCPLTPINCTENFLIIQNVDYMNLFNVSPDIWIIEVVLHMGHSCKSLKTIDYPHE